MKTASRNTQGLLACSFIRLWPGCAKQGGCAEEWCAMRGLGQYIYIQDREGCRGERNGGWICQAKSIQLPSYLHLLAQSEPEMRIKASSPCPSSHHTRLRRGIQRISIFASQRCVALCPYSATWRVGLLSDVPAVWRLSRRCVASEALLRLVDGMCIQPHRPAYDSPAPTSARKAVYP
ncbi:hypothetical protein BDW22DRAFT_1001014 [Trametopsis cervina]|nr:hypothetical protein BDW22DRAFT_1001014 [Trametopsis cervina]